MDRIAVSAGDVVGVTNDADVGPVAVSHSAGPARILRRPIVQDRHPHTRGQHHRAAAGGPEVGKVYEFGVVPFALEFSLNADIGTNYKALRECIYPPSTR